MKPIFYLIVTTLLWSACTSTQKNVAGTDERSPLLSTLKRLNKKATNAEAAKALPDLYTRVQKRYLDSIVFYSSSKEVGRWNNILANYRGLQDMYEAINGSAAATKLVQAVNYQNDISKSNEQAADEYYRLGLDLLSTGNRAEAAKAYQFLKTALFFVPGYKDAATQMDKAFKNSMVLVAISNIRTNGHGFGGIPNDYTQVLVSELGTRPNNANQVYFYTEKEAKENNVHPDWQIKIEVTKLDMQTPSSSTSSRYNSVQVIDGYDTSRNPIYSTVSANIASYSYAVFGDVDVSVQIVENGTSKSIANKKLDYGYKWQNDYVSYSGDSRALSTQESMLAGKGYRDTPGETEMLSEAVSKLKPAIKQFIIAAINAHFGR
jgi:hypothetical protein